MLISFSESIGRIHYSIFILTMSDNLLLDACRHFECELTYIAAQKKEENKRIENIRIGEREIVQAINYDR